MATLSGLVASGHLEQIDVDFEQGEVPERYLYASKRAIIWLRDKLPTLESDGFVEGALTPQEQCGNLFHNFIAGKDISEFPPHVMDPSDPGIWELRTADLRVFGWFWKAGMFVISAIDTAENCKKGLYSGYRNQAVRDRDQLDLDPPKFISGTIADVL